MTLQQLEYFVSAAHNLNFSKTAEMFLSHSLPSHSRSEVWKRTEAGSVYSEK